MNTRSDKSLPKPISVSVILATHNRMDLLPKAVESLLRQTYQDFEIIIVDDASTDGTPDLLSKLQEGDKRILSIRSDKNIGPGAARNLGIARAKGKYIAIMDDDDLSVPERFELQVAYLEEHPETDLVFSNIEHIDAEGQHIGFVTRHDFPSEPAQAFELLYLESNKIPNAVIMVKRSLFDYYHYPENIWIGEDWYLFMQMAAKGVRMGVITQPLLRVLRGANRQGLMSESRDKMFLAQQQVLRMIKEWLNSEDIHEFDHLHRMALSNQIIFESRHFIGIKGFSMLIYAFFICPRNPKVFAQIKWYLSRLIYKIRQS